jgi:hypothetical protein
MKIRIFTPIQTNGWHGLLFVAVQRYPHHPAIYVFGSPL